MYQLDKKRFGAFLSQLRREKGLTQKELADQLYISNQAVSKWETGVSIPDASLLIPLADLLGVTVTELLQGEPINHNQNLTTPQVEQLVRTVICYPQTNNPLTPQEQYDRKIRLYLYLLFTVIAAIGLLLLNVMLPILSFWRHMTFLPAMLLLSLFLGIYFMLFADSRHPILGFHGTVWTNIIRFGRSWCMTMLVLTPLLSFFVYSFWAEYDVFPLLLLLIGSFLIPIFNISNKTE